MTNRKWFPQPKMSLTLLILWLVLNSTLAPAHLLLGALIGWVIPLGTNRLWARDVDLHRLGVATRLLGIVLYDILIANLAVARLILGPVSKLRPAFIQVPLDLKEPYAIWTLASIITLTPGTVSSVLSEDRRTLLVHALDVDNVDEVIAQIKERYETPLREIFE